MSFKLDRQLVADTYLLHEADDYLLLLHQKAWVPWFIIVPKSEHSEWYELSDALQDRINGLINRLSGFLKQKLNADKLNIATIGNVVSQLHIHVIGRYKDDYCWPSVVWGQGVFKPYADDELNRLRSLLKEQGMLL
ncbi:MAG: HIT family protein [Francisellaceae bacterium]